MRGIPRRCPRDRCVLTRFFPERAEVALVVVELRAARCPAASRDSRTPAAGPRARGGASAGSAASQACAGAASASASASNGTKIALHAMPGQGFSACSSAAWPSTRNRMRRCTRARSSQKSSFQRKPRTRAISSASSHWTIAPPSSSSVSRSRRRPRRPRSRGISCGVQRVDQRLRPREGEPGERVEQIVQVAGARLHLAGLEQLDLVVRVSGCGRHEPYRAPGCGPEIAFLRQSVEASERAVLAQALEPGPNRVEDRVG